MSKIILTLLACVVVACAEELHLDQETNSFVAANISKTQAIKTDKTWIEDEDDKILVKNIKENIPKGFMLNFFVFIFLSFFFVWHSRIKLFLMHCFA